MTHDRSFRPEQTCIAPFSGSKDARRLEIDELLDDPAQTNLFLLALAEMQSEPVRKADEENWLSYYNLAAVHGNPTEKWNNMPPYIDDKNQAPIEEFEPYWYCTHGTDVFPPFHRVYMMAFENALHAKARRIAEQFNEPWRAYYLRAADLLRLPFWDPFMPRKERSGPVESVWGMPEIVKATEVYVRTFPHNERLRIPNPLFSYKLPDPSAIRAVGREPIDFDKSFGKGVAIPEKARQATVRTPNEHGDCQIDVLEKAIRKQGVVASAKVWQLLRQDTYENKDRTWKRFSNHSKLPAHDKEPDNDHHFRKMGISLESWHDDIHLLTGSAISWTDGVKTKNPIPGWMAQVEVAAALFPEKYITDDGAKWPETDLTSWLRPFNNADGSHCTSADMKAWQHLGFAVPGVNNIEGDSAAQEEIMRYLERTYYWASETDPAKQKLPEGWPRPVLSSFALSGEDSKDSPVFGFDAVEKLQDGQVRFVRRQIPVPLPGTAAAPVDDMVIKELGPIAGPAAGREMTRVWNAYINVKKYAFGGSFVVHIFFGDPGLESAAYMMGGNEVGFAGVFAARPGAACARCESKDEAGTLYEDVVPLTPRLEELGVDCMDVAATCRFLEANMKWRVVDVSGRVMTEEQLRAAGLQISVWERYYNAPTEERKLGKYHEARMHPSVTSGQVGGYAGE